MKIYNIAVVTDLAQDLRKTKSDKRKAAIAGRINDYVGVLRARFGNEKLTEIEVEKIIKWVDKNF